MTPHPLTRTLEQMEDALLELGFRPAAGPCAETPAWNFSRLNIPPEHVERDADNAFFLPTRPPRVLRTHTTSVQARRLARRRVPLREFTAGRVYRPETRDRMHALMFHQCDAYAVERAASLADLRGVLAYVLRRIFGAKTTLRLRGAYFPFTQPSFEVDVACRACRRRGCSLCRAGWCEVAGAGLIDPEVLRLAGLDAKSLQGFAFGLGVERTAMVRFGITDIEQLHDPERSF